MSTKNSRPYIEIRFDRFSSAYGYGYVVATVLKDSCGGRLTITRKRLHCVFGSTVGLDRRDVSITAQTLQQISKFLGKNGFWGKTIRKYITPKQEWALIRAHIL